VGPLSQYEKLRVSFNQALLICRHLLNLEGEKSRMFETLDEICFSQGTNTRRTGPLAREFLFDFLRMGQDNCF